MKDIKKIEKLLFPHVEESYSRNNELFKPRKNIIRAYKDLFQSEKGEMILHDLAKQTGYFGYLEPTDSEIKTGYYLGKREVFRYILEKIYMELKEDESIT